MPASQLTILLVRHAEPINFERARVVADSDSSRTECDAVLFPLKASTTLTNLQSHSVRRSQAPSIPAPRRRARQTVEPLAQHLGIAIEIVDDLRERLLAPPNLRYDWQIHMQRAWHDFDYVLPAGESSRQAQHRILRVLDELRTRHETGTIVVASHGNVIALALHAAANGIDHEFWKIDAAAGRLLGRTRGEWLARSGSRPAINTWDEEGASISQSSSACQQDTKLADENNGQAPRKLDRSSVPEP